MRTDSSVSFWMLLAATVAVPHSLAAQAFPGFESVEARVGAYVPDNADPGFGASIDVGLGYLGSPAVRTLAGFNYFTAHVDRASGTSTVGGDITGVGGRLGVRLDPFGAMRFAPYLAATITAHRVDAEAENPANQDLLDDVYGGFLVGAGLGVGGAYAFDETGRYGVTAELRRVFVTDVAHWAGEVGIRVVPRGREAYTRVFAPAPIAEPSGQTNEALLAAEREAERLRAESQRNAQLTQAERMRAQQEVDALRQRADTLELARQREAEARAAAEREATAARAQAEAAALRAREAQERAEAAERQFYDALLDLDRLIANVTEIRESERGLSVVLGQGLFASGQSTLSPQARTELGRIAAVLAQFPAREIVVAGHTDAAGTEVANQRLSELRAEAVRAALIAQGLNPARVTMVGYGEAQPIADNTTPAGRAQNRRVEMLIVGARRPAVTPR